mmetsp:Transcript_10198/g.20531  ORF Transcript_10198/g.20531 Transcript_10198/m.20531 type:complete len:122 (+) Transcript_10198:73-438(+)
MEDDAVQRGYHRRQRRGHDDDGATRCIGKCISVAVPSITTQHRPRQWAAKQIGTSWRWTTPSGRSGRSGTRTMCTTGPDGVHSYEKNDAEGHTKGKLANIIKVEPQIPLLCRSGAARGQSS